MILQGEDLEWARGYVEDHRWQQAKADGGGRWPHQYTVREWEPDDFLAMVKLIRRYGYPERFFKHTRIYLILDGWKYWTMGDTLDSTRIINRADPDNRHGTQDAPDTRTPCYVPVYDELAPDYDARYSTKECRAENEAVALDLSCYQGGTILDVGCGTGLYLDLFRGTHPSAYLGVDPSQAMCNEFIRKHAGYSIHTGFVPRIERHFDVAIALFGVASYLSTPEIERIHGLADHTYLMFYGEDYLPDYYGPPETWDQLDWHRDRDNRLNAAQLASGAGIRRFANYWIVES